MRRVIVVAVVVAVFVSLALGSALAYGGAPVCRLLTAAEMRATFGGSCGQDCYWRCHAENGCDTCSSWDILDCDNMKDTELVATCVDGTGGCNTSGSQYDCGWNYSCNVVEIPPYCDCDDCPDKNESCGTVGYKTCSE